MNTLCFEPLGSNCEFGFVLCRLGNTRPSLFRWTAIDISNVIVLLDNGFADCFETATVHPHTPAMVISQPYRWAFHSALHSSPEGVFTAPPARLARLFDIERARIHSEIDIFTRRLQDGGVIATFSAPHVADEEALALLAAIDRFAGHSRNQVLIVSPNPTPGKTQKIASRATRGTVAWLASYDQADAADYDNWHTVMTQMLDT